MCGQPELLWWELQLYEVLPWVIRKFLQCSQEGDWEGGCRLGVTKTYRDFICHAVHLVTLQFCNCFPFISCIPSLTHH